MTVAVTLAVARTCREPGGVGAMATEIPIETILEEVLVESVAEAAVMVTEPPAGAAGGAV